MRLLVSGFGFGVSGWDGMGLFFDRGLEGLNARGCPQSSIHSRGAAGTCSRLSCAPVFAMLRRDKSAWRGGGRWEFRVLGFESASRRDPPSRKAMPDRRRRSQVRIRSDMFG